MDETEADWADDVFSLWVHHIPKWSHIQTGKGMLQVLPDDVLSLALPQRPNGICGQRAKAWAPQFLSLTQKGYNLGEIRVRNSSGIYVSADNLSWCV